MPLREEQPGEFQIGSFRFRVVPLGERLVVHCDLFPTVVYARPRAEVTDRRRLVAAAAEQMVNGSGYGPLDVPRGLSWDAWQARIDELAGELDAWLDDAGAGDAPPGPPPAGPGPAPGPTPPGSPPG